MSSGCFVYVRRFWILFKSLILSGNHPIYYSLSCGSWCTFVGCGSNDSSFSQPLVHDFGPSGWSYTAGATTGRCAWEGRWGFFNSVLCVSGHWGSGVSGLWWQATSCSQVLAAVESLFPGRGGASQAHGDKGLPRLSCLLQWDPFCWSTQLPPCWVSWWREQFQAWSKGEHFSWPLIISWGPNWSLHQWCWALLMTLEGLWLGHGRK